MRTISESRASRSWTPSKRQSSANPETAHKDKHNIRENALLLSLKQSYNQTKTSLELFNKLHSNNMAQRCLQHNNVISLYCINQHKLLCVNCVYSQTRHKAHKIIPLSQSSTDIDKDIGTNAYKVAQKLTSLEIIEKTSLQNMQNLQKSKGNLINKLDEQFDEIMRSMATKYLELKTSLSDYYQQQMELNKHLNKQSRQLCDIINQGLDRLDNLNEKGNHREGAGNPTFNELYKHLAMNSISSGVNLSADLKSVGNDIEHLQSVAQKEILRLKAQLTKFKWSRIY